MTSQPAAFMSYARFDDQHEDGQLSQFRQRLSAEIRMQTGREFPIFQDRADIAWGQNWQRRIDESLDEATLLLAILTPSFFNSAPCRSEVQRFLERERKLGRQDLILPVYYVSTAELDDPTRHGRDDLVRILAMRQYADWRELRFEPLTSPVTRRAIARLAGRMRSPFWRPEVAVPDSADPRMSAMETGPVESSLVRPTPARPLAKTEPPTHIVDQYLRGDFATVADAIIAAQPGDRILIRPGLYREALVVDKPLEIIGDGPVDDIEIQVRGADALQFRASIGRISNLTIRQVGGDGAFSAVEISQGRLELEGCDISSRSKACVLIVGGADPRLRRNAIHDSLASGVVIDDQSLGSLEDNDIFGHGQAGVAISNDSNPTLRRNTIHDNKICGVGVERRGKGIIEDNEITSNLFSGVQVRIEGEPILRRNVIHDNKGNGCQVYDEGRGIIQDNDITKNGKAGIATNDDGNPTVRGNRINRNRSHAVAVYRGGKGVFEDNDLTANQGGAWFIDEDCKGDVTQARNRE